jgi:hypothetical protein
LLFGIENGNSIAKQIVIGFENGKLKIWKKNMNCKNECYLELKMELQNK